MLQGHLPAEWLYLPWGTEGLRCLDYYSSRCFLLSPFPRRRRLCQKEHFPYKCSPLWSRFAMPDQVVQKSQLEFRSPIHQSSGHQNNCSIPRLCLHILPKRRISRVRSQKSGCLLSWSFSRCRPQLRQRYWPLSRGSWWVCCPRW